MSEWRRAKNRTKPDANAAEIKAALEKAGVQVEIVGRPLDLLCNHRGRTFVVECKVKGGRRTPAQVKFLARWRGEVHVVESPLEAIAAVTGGSV